MTNIYLVNMIDIKRKTKADWEKEFKIFNINYKSTYKCLNNYKEFIKGTYKCSDYIITEEIVGYFTNKKTAQHMLSKNIYDVNDGGIYPYAIIIELPANVFYPESFSMAKRVHIYKFVKNSTLNTMIYKCLVDENGGFKKDNLLNDEEFIKVLFEYYK